MIISEEFVHFIWEKQLAGRFFTLKSGEKCEIQHPGRGENRDGPDFEDARIIIDGILLAGQVEIHLKSSDWYRHQHHKDEAYEKVILHVVLNYDKAVFDINKREIPVLELCEDQVLKWKETYEAVRLKLDSPFICAEYLKKLPKEFIHKTLCVKGEERLAKKAEYIKTLHQKLNQNWDAVLYQVLMRAFGLNKNIEAMEMLADSLPWNILAREKENLLPLEALLLGQAGMLNKPLNHDYFKKLQQEYSYLKHKHKIQSVSKNVWKYSPVRPPAMPDLRLAQIAAFFHSVQSITGAVLSLETKEDAYDLFNTKVSVFWTDHYTLNGKEKIHKNTKPGKSFLDLITINTIAPFMLAWADITFQDRYKYQALSLLQNIGSEKNKIIATFVEELKDKPASALESQGLIELFYSLCSSKNCQKCPFMKELMQTRNQNE